MQDGKNARDVAWRLFAKTGDLSYYALYTRLSDEEEGEGKR